MKTRPRQLHLQCLTLMAILGALFTTGPAGAQYYGGLMFNPLILSTSGQAGHDPAGAAIDQAFSTPLVALRNARTIYGLKLGYRIADHLTIEGSYSELARANYGVAPLSGALPRNPDARGYGLDLVGVAPLHDRLSLFGRAGIQNIRADIPSGSAGNIDLTLPVFAQTTTAARFGIGVRYDISNSLGLRLEAERFRKLGGSSLGEFSADNYSFGLLLKF